MLIKVLLLLCGVLAVTGIIQYVYYSVNMQSGANRFVFTLGFTVLLAVPLIYHLMMGDAAQLSPFKLILMAYIPVAFFWVRLDLLRKAYAVRDDEELL